MKISGHFIGAVAAILAGAATLLPAAAQQTSELARDSVIETIKQRGEIRIGLSVFKPWSMRDKNGDLIGFELDVGRKLADDMGVNVEFVPTAWDGIIPALLVGKFDTIISGMSVTATRNLTVNFTDPYAFSGLSVFANKQMTDGFSQADFNRPDVTFAARRGTTPATVIKRVFPDANLLLFDEDGAAAQEVLNGAAHASMQSIPNATREVRQYPETLYAPFDTTYDPRGEGFAIRKGDFDAMNLFNNWIATNWRNGWLEERHDYWFKTTDWDDQVAD